MNELVAIKPNEEKYDYIGLDFGGIFEAPLETTLYKDSQSYYLNRLGSRNIPVIIHEMIVNIRAAAPVFVSPKGNSLQVGNSHPNK
jgi:hypothetical protein